MYHVEYLFDLDVADKELAGLMKSAGMPFPVLKNAVRNTLTYNAPRMLTQDEQKEFIKTCCAEFKNTDLGKFLVVEARYAGIADAYFVPNDEGQKKTAPERTPVTVKPRKI